MYVYMQQGKLILFLAHFNYCQMVLHFCCKASTKLALIQERALKDEKSTYHELLQKSYCTITLIRQIKAIVGEVFKLVDAI